MRHAGNAPRRGAVSAFYGSKLYYGINEAPHAQTVMPFSSCNIYANGQRPTANG